MTGWILESDSVPTNIFPPKNIRKFGFNSGSWIEVFQEQNHQNCHVHKTKKRVQIKKIMNFDEVRAAHGNIKLENLVKLRLSGKRFTEVNLSEMKGLKPVAIDFNVNSLNLADIENLCHNTQILEMAFNNIKTLRIINHHAFNNIIYMDLSWNFLTDKAVACLRKLENIKSLDLTGNKFEYFPVQDSDFEHLIELRYAKVGFLNRYNCATDCESYRVCSRA